jgi:hypothetical protein
MNHSIKVGFSFGLTSGIITTLGLLVGLYSITNSRLIVLGGILMIAIADALSDAFGIHMSEESEQKHTARQIWQSTVTAFLFKFFFALIFAVPILVLELQPAVIASVILGMAILGVMSYYMPKAKAMRWRTVAEHLIIAVVVVAATYYLGKWVALVFGAI